MTEAAQTTAAEAAAGRPQEMRRPQETRTTAAELAVTQQMRRKLRQKLRRMVRLKLSRKPPQHMTQRMTQNLTRHRPQD